MKSWFFILAVALNANRSVAGILVPGQNPVISITSATISGGGGGVCFSVKSPTLVVDCTNSRVGIGTALPATLLDVNGASQFGSGVTKSTIASTGEATFITSTVGSGNALILKNQNANNGNSVGISFQNAQSGGVSAATGRIVSSNTSPGDTGGAFLFQTRPTGSGPFTTGIQIDSSQNVVIGSSLTVSFIQPPGGFALCVLNGSLGHCTSIVGVGGGCTCVSP